MADKIFFSISLSTGEAVKNLGELEGNIKSLKNSLKSASDPETFKRLSTELDKNSKELKKFNTEAKNISVLPGTVGALRLKVSELNQQWKNTAIGTQEFKNLE